MTDLPRLVPLFPLPNVVLFPGCPLPLHIFEPRYREMVRDAADGESRLIGMVLLRGDWRPRYHESPDVFALGCAGRMVSVEPLPDGRSNILLEGLREFTIEKEVGDCSYRRAEVVWRPAETQALDDAERRHLRGLLRKVLPARSRGPERKLLADPSISDELLVNFFCFSLAFSAIEKQALLEASSLRERASRLCDMVSFTLSAGQLPADDAEEIRYH